VRVIIPWGLQQLELDVGDDQLVGSRRGPVAPRLDDPAQAVRNALDKPYEYPALYRALTPEDHVAIAVDETIPNLGTILVPLLEHLAKGHVSPELVTLLCTSPSTGQPWLEDLPDEFLDVKVEVHQPGDRRKLSYLAATKKGKRIYLNRTIVDADQTVLLTRRNYDPLLGVSGAEAVSIPRSAMKRRSKKRALTCRSMLPDKNRGHCEKKLPKSPGCSALPFCCKSSKGQATMC